MASATLNCVTKLEIFGLDSAWLHAAGFPDQNMVISTNLVIELIDKAVEQAEIIERLRSYVKTQDNKPWNDYD